MKSFLSLLGITVLFLSAAQARTLTGTSGGAAQIDLCAVFDICPQFEKIETASKTTIYYTAYLPGLESYDAADSIIASTSSTHLDEACEHLDTIIETKSDSYCEEEYGTDEDGNPKCQTVSADSLTGCTPNRPEGSESSRECTHIPQFGASGSENAGLRRIKVVCTQHVKNRLLISCDTAVPQCEEGDGEEDQDRKEFFIR